MEGNHEQEDPGKDEKHSAQNETAHGTKYGSRDRLGSPRREPFDGRVIVHFSLSTAIFSGGANSDVRNILFEILFLFNEENRKSGWRCSGCDS